MEELCKTSIHAIPSLNEFVYRFLNMELEFACGEVKRDGGVEDHDILNF